MGNNRFILGVVIIILSFIIGILCKVFLVLYILNRGVELTLLIIYAISWLMLIPGVYLCGREGYEYSKKLYRRYTSYKTYHRHIKKGIKKGSKTIKKGTRQMTRQSKRIIVNSGKVINKGRKNIHRRKEQLQNALTRK